MSTPDVLLFGSLGQLGWELTRSLATFGEVEAIDQEDLDLVDSHALRKYILAQRPRTIVNASAYTNVDGAESQPSLAYKINALAPEVMAETAEILDAVLVHYSTDYVFSGQKDKAYTESDLPDPLNVYGQSKLAGEQAVLESGCAHLIFRTSWVYSFRQPSFPNKVLEWARTQEQLRIVDDQIGSPTWARMLAEVTTQVLMMGAPDIGAGIREKSGLYHLAGRGACSRFELARETLDLYNEIAGQRLATVIPAKSEEFPSPAQRPAYSALDCATFERAFDLRLPPWRESLRQALAGHITQ